MKLVVTGATGFVGTEVIRQALRNPNITAVVALARKPVLPPDAEDNVGASKLQSIILEDWTSPYSESVNQKLKGADACIWTLAVTPSRSKDTDFADVTEICFDYTITGLKNMTAVANTPFRFVYTSGIAVERDQNKVLTVLAEYRHMRGRVENAILDFAEQHAPNVQITVTKPGAIDGPHRENMVKATVKGLAQVGSFDHALKVHVSELAAAMIDQCLNGITKDPLWGEDLEKIGQSVLREEDYLR